MPTVAKVFMSGHSQAVRLPKEFRLDCTEVYIRRSKNGLELEPKKKESTWSEFFANHETFPDFERPPRNPVENPRVENWAD
jgi:antitoxin VapB